MPLKNLDEQRGLSPGILRRPAAEAALVRGILSWG
jgi:hypothetical protein